MDNTVITGMHPKVLEALQKTIAEAKARNIIIGLHDGLRPAIKSEQLYALGRTVANPDGKTDAKPLGNIVTNAHPWESWHNYGLAGDLVFKNQFGNWTWSKTPAEWEALGVIGEMFGLEWGGRWKMADYPHFQMKGKILSVHFAKATLFEHGIEALWGLV